MAKTEQNESAERKKLIKCCELLNTKEPKNGKDTYTEVQLNEENPKNTDLIGKRNGEKVYIEIKWTSKKDCFGAATLTEWTPYLEGKNLDFVVVKGESNQDPKDWEYKVYSPKEFMKYSTIPPFKVNFNIDIDDEYKHTNHPKALDAKKEYLAKLYDIYQKLSIENKEKKKNIIDKKKKTNKK